jgi:hypothetical protein
MAGVNLLDTFEEEHMESPSLPRFNTRARSSQHSANNAQHIAPCVFRPIPFTNTEVFHAAPKQAINQIPMVNAVINQETGASLEYCQLIQDGTTLPIWNKEAANAFGRLAQGAGGQIEVSNTIFLIPRRAIPKGKNVTYGHFMVDIRPTKIETRRVRIAVGGNLLQYPGDVPTSLAYLISSKCLWNSTISDKCDRYMCLDVKKFYMGTPMDSFEYI